MISPTSPGENLLGARDVAAIAGRTDRWVRSMAQEGHFEKDVRGKYRLGGLIRGLIAHYEAIIEKGSKSAASSRVTDARTREIELRIAEKERSLIPVEDAEIVVEIICGAVNTQLTSLPARITRDVRMRREIEAKVYEARVKIHEAIAAARQLAETGVDPTDPGAVPSRRVIK